MSSVQIVNEGNNTYRIRNRNEGVIVSSYKLTNVHDKKLCAARGGYCVIHNPADHKMRDWPLWWRADTGLFERLCQHGCGHPDPSQLDYWYESGQEWKAIHGCEGCCYE